MSPIPPPQLGLHLIKHISVYNHPQIQKTGSENDKKGILPLHYYDDDYDDNYYYYYFHLSHKSANKSESKLLGTLQ